MPHRTVIVATEPKLFCILGFGCSDLGAEHFHTRGFDKTQKLVRGGRRCAQAFVTCGGNMRQRWLGFLPRPPSEPRQGPMSPRCLKAPESSSSDQKIDYAPNLFATLWICALGSVSGDRPHRHPGFGRDGPVRDTSEGLYLRRLGAAG